MAHDIAKVAIRYKVPSPAVPPDITGVITFHVHKAVAVGGWNAALLQTLVARVYQWWADPVPPTTAPFPNLQSFYPGTFSIVDISARQIRPSIGAPQTQTVMVGTTGTGGGTLWAPQLCYGLGLRTSLSSRRGRGRIYLPCKTPFSGGSIGYIPDVSTLQDVGKLGAVLAARIISPVPGPAPWALAVYSRKNLDSNAVTFFDVADRALTQRRRAAKAKHQRVGLDGALNGAPH